MRPKNRLLAWALMGSALMPAAAQTAGGSDHFAALPDGDRTLYYDVSAAGEQKPIIWGLDLAWLSEENIRRGIVYMGKENIDVVRSSFTPTAPLVGDSTLAADELKTVNSRISLIKLLKPDVQVVLNSDHPSVDSYFKGNAVNWAKLIEVTARRHAAKGLKVITVSPFNEPDFSSTGQGNIWDFFNIAGELRKNPYFDSIRISGGNTLNCDKASEWYSVLKSRLDEGNTHQLAGDFDHYAAFYQQVRADGKHATNDELHNVMEAMVGVEYGMQTGIWWGTAEYARGEFVKASDGERLAYAEHRPKWTAASVYRSPQGKVQAFVGSSERQAATTTYNFVSKSRDVFYDGHGPQREYSVTVPGGTDYQVGQVNAERVVNITWGADVAPVVDGTYVVTNRYNKRAIGPENGSNSEGTAIGAATAKMQKWQQWRVTPVAPDTGGDHSYFNFINEASGLTIDLLNYSLSNGGTFIAYGFGNSTNQQFFLEYAEDGWFYIRNRHSGKYLEIYTTNGSTIRQNDFTGQKNQQWRFLSPDITPNYKAPAAPQGLTATGQNASVLLQWQAVDESDVAGYNVLRSSTAGGPYELIARDVKGTAYVDNRLAGDSPRYYVVKAVDESLNGSEFSEEATAAPTGERGMVLHYGFAQNVRDTTLNLNHAATQGAITYSTFDDKELATLKLAGSSYLQLPTDCATHDSLSFAAWVYPRSSTTGLPLFDFGSGQGEHIGFTHRNAGNKSQLTLCRADGSEQLLTATALATYKWSHLVVTIGQGGCSIYINGELSAQSADCALRPAELCTLRNYVGRSNSGSSLFKGDLADLRLYNCILTADEVSALYADPSTAIEQPRARHFAAAIEAGSLQLSLPAAGEVTLYNLQGKVVMRRSFGQGGSVSLPVGALPASLYMVRWQSGSHSAVSKFAVR